MASLDAPDDGLWLRVQVQRRAVDRQHEQLRRLLDELVAFPGHPLAPNQILREGARRRIVVSANTDGVADMAQVVAGIRRTVAAWPYAARLCGGLEGTFQAQEEASMTIALLSAVSLTLIFVVLYSRYRSTQRRWSSWATCRSP